jgi:hypothetical protein
MFDPPTSNYRAGENDIYAPCCVQMGVFELERERERERREKSKNWGVHYEKYICLSEWLDFVWFLTSPPLLAWAYRKIFPEYVTSTGEICRL